MNFGRFTFRSADEGRDLAHVLAEVCAMPEQVSFGLNEMMMNAVEHGNLEITYEQKTALVRAGTWSAEIERRLATEPYRDRCVVVELARSGNEAVFTIRDEGKGFDWTGYLSLTAKRAADPHGRGIALSAMMSFSSLTYLGCGNVVVCKAPLAARG